MIQTKCQYLIHLTFQAPGVAGSSSGFCTHSVHNFLFRYWVWARSKSIEFMPIPWSSLLQLEHNHLPLYGHPLLYTCKPTHSTKLYPPLHRWYLDIGRDRRFPLGRASSPINKGRVIHIGRRRGWVCTVTSANDRPCLSPVLSCG